MAVFFFFNDFLMETNFLFSHGIGPFCVVVKSFDRRVVGLKWKYGFFLKETAVFHGKTHVNIRKYYLYHSFCIVSQYIFTPVC